MPKRRHTNFALISTFAAGVLAFGCGENKDRALKTEDVFEKTPIAEGVDFVFETKQYVKTSIFVLLDDQGMTQQGIDINYLKDSFNTLNPYFADMNVEFVPVSLVFIPAADYFLADDLGREEIMKTVMEENSINTNLNLFYAPWARGSGENYPVVGIEGQVVLIGPLGLSPEISPTVVPHEVGHKFGLFHTFEKISDEMPRVDGIDCERTGDLVCDTPADPGTKNLCGPEALPSCNDPEVLQGCVYDHQTCELISCGKDETGVEYQPDVTNLMGYYFGCGTSFSPQQMAKMKRNMIKGNFVSSENPFVEELFVSPTVTVGIDKDFESIQVAANFLTSVGGGKMIVSAGVYSAVDISLGDNVDIVIEAEQGSDVFVDGGGSTFVFDVGGRSGASGSLELRGVNLRNSGSGDVCFSASMLKKLHISDLQITNCGSGGMSFDDVENFEINRVEIADSQTTYGASSFFVVDSSGVLENVTVTDITGANYPILYMIGSVLRLADFTVARITAEREDAALMILDASWNMSSFLEVLGDVQFREHNAETVLGVKCNGGDLRMVELAREVDTDEVCSR